MSVSFDVHELRGVIWLRHQKWRNLMSLSDFNTVLNQVLALTEATTTECGLLPPDSIERHRCEGKLLAWHQVIEFFLEFSWRLTGESLE